MGGQIVELDHRPAKYRVAMRLEAMKPPGQARQWKGPVITAPAMPNDLSRVSSPERNALENRPFDEIRIGDSASLTRELTLVDLKTFAVLSGDLNPTHVDEDFARMYGEGRVVAHAMLSGALISSVLGNELPGPVPMTLYGFSIGFFGSLMGVSGGAISTIILTVYGKPIHNAIATSSGVAVPVVIAGAIGFMLAGLPHQAELPPLSLGFVSLIGFAVIAPVASYVAPYGAHLAHRLPRRTLEIAFGAFLLAVSLRFLVSLF